MTDLLYLKDFNVEDCTATVTSIELLADNRFDVQLDQTCLYPRGGGQDWDTGTITAHDSMFRVDQVRIDENGDVHHLGTFGSTVFAKADLVKCQVDHDRRHINTRLHSAGHVIDMAVDALSLGWVPTKGQHFPDLSAIEYSGDWNPEMAEGLRGSIQNKTRELVATGSSNSLRFMDKASMKAVCKNVPDIIPDNKPTRVVMYGEDFGIPCGGTHLKDISEIGTINVTKLKCKKGTIRLSYAVEGIN